MKKLSLLALLLLTASCSTSTGPDGESQSQPYAPDGIPFAVADSAWQADQYGNHRAVVEVSDAAPNSTVQVTLPWRRPDLRPETKKIVVTDARTGQNVNNVTVRELTSERGQIAFEATTGNGTYYVYYLPYRFRKGWDDARYGDPWNDYLAPEYPDSAWLANSSAPAVEGRVVRFESRTRFDAFTPMGNIATAAETEQLLAQHPENPVLFTEDRAFPIRLTRQLPVRWIQNGPSDHFEGVALRNEYYVWQIGIWAAHDSLRNVRLAFSDFRNGDQVIPSDSVTCFNQEGTNWDGQPLTFTINVPNRQIQALWCGIQIPQDAATGTYTGTATLTADGIEPRPIDIQIEVKKQLLADKGDSDLWRHARLRWLNSTIGMDDQPIAPFQAMSLDGKTITATEKSVQLGESGLPASIRLNEREVLAAPMDFVVSTAKGDLHLTLPDLQLRKSADGLIEWEGQNSQQGITFRCTGRMEFDGYLHYEIALSADQPTEVSDIRLETNYTPYASEYCMGAGLKGGKSLRRDYRWDWYGPWDSYWMGNAQAGLHVEFRGGTYHGPLLNDYKPAPPATWANNGKGSVRFSFRGDAARVVATCGPSTLTPEARTYEFDLKITPTKPLDTRQQFAQRYYHSVHTGFDKAAEEGANIANIHHAQPLNPVINYPFIVRDSLKAFIAHEHEAGRKVKLYYTIRELSNYAQEIYALKSLGHEILVSGPGYGLPWHCEHLIDDYKAAWYTELPGETSDAALVLNGFSRWINYYLEGLRWMFENYDIDGIYMDDVSFDRPVMKRMRRIMNQYHPGALIDLHSNTNYSIGPANQYTGFFPYVNRLWFGESFQYNVMGPDEWFVTFSGIPFGVMSEMLQDGGNRFLGTVYGATARHSYGAYSPAPVWKLWKEFGIEEAAMKGYWDDDCPVATSDPEVKATAYVRPDRTLIAVGNFSTDPKQVRLTIDWQAIGIPADQAVISAPEVQDFQSAQTFRTGDALQIPAKEGLLLLITPSGK